MTVEEARRKQQEERDKLAELKKRKSYSPYRSVRDEGAMRAAGLAVARAGRE